MPDMKTERLTLDRIAEYRIHIQGILDTGAREWIDGEILPLEDGTTMVSGHYDQASLHGVLSWLYARGLPLISARRIEVRK